MVLVLTLVLDLDGYSSLKIFRLKYFAEQFIQIFGKLILYSYVSFLKYAVILYAEVRIRDRVEFYLQRI